MTHEFHCDKHKTFISTCDGCEKAKREYWIKWTLDPLPAPDITAKKHGGNKFSEKANPRSSKKLDDINKLYQWWTERGAAGAIAEEGYQACGLLTQTGSARCSDMKKTGLLVDTGRVGKTQTGSPAAVLVADTYALPPLPPSDGERSNVSEAKVWKL